MAYSDDFDGAVEEEPRYWELSGIGFLFAAFFFGAALTPSLIPRDPFMQGVLCGVAAAVGYMVGSFLAWLWRFMLLPIPGGQARLWVRIGLFGAGLAVAVLFLFQAEDWANASRAVVDAPPVETTQPFLIAGVGAAVFAVLWLVGSLFLFVFRRAGRFLGRFLPGRLGPALGLVVAAVLFYWAVEGVLWQRIFAAADASFAAREAAFVEAQTEPPTQPELSGSPDSLIDWEEMGSAGRDFISRTPTPAEIEEFTGEPALTPIRVYVGRRNADTENARAQLALDELIRAGAFDREVLVITTPVGTGWMDPGSHDVIDFMMGGDVAQVAAQYSYLTSVLSMMVQLEYGLDQARELFEVIYGYWATLPAEERPRLYVHGLSQGALNSQATLPFFDTFGDPFHGAVWAGSPFVSPVWQRVRDDRHDDTPVWAPRYGNGSLARVTNQDDLLEQFDAPWGPMRFVFLHYGSDPIVHFDLRSIWRKPDFLREPRAPDVPPEMRWYPFVTAFQVGLDMIFSLGYEGHGHYYYYDDYIDAWAEVLNPEDWSEERADELRAIFAERPPPW